MAGRPEQQASRLEGIHLVLYDGACGLCSRLVQLVLKHDHVGIFNFASFQSTAGTAVVQRGGGDPTELTTFYVVANYRTHRMQTYTRSRAALFVAGRLRWPWKAAVLLRVLPTATLDSAYDFVARHRYALFGQSQQCLTADPASSRRFIDE